MGSSLLDRSFHKNPCSQSWAAMQGDDEVRHCAQCDQNVYNLSALTRAEAEKLLEDHRGNLCTAFYRRPDGSILTQRCPAAIRTLSRRLSRAVAAVASIAPFLPVPALGQFRCPESSAEIKIEQGQSTQISGIVFDVTGAIIPGAVVTVEREGERLQVKSDRFGKFSTERLEPATYLIRVESPGFKNYEKDGLEVAKGAVARLKVELQVGSVGGNALLPADEIIAAE